MSDFENGRSSGGGDFLGGSGSDGPGASAPEGAGGGDAAFEHELARDPFAAGGGRRKLNGGAFIMLGVVAAAVGGLYSMRMLTTLTAADNLDTSTEKTVNEYLERLAKASEDDPEIITDPVLMVLGDDYANQQVPLERVQKDPFIIFTLQGVEKPEKPVKSNAPDPEQLRAERRALIEREGATFSVTSIVKGERPMAIVDEQIVQPGETILSTREELEFTVLTIEGDTVMLGLDDPLLGEEVRVAVSVQRDLPGEKRRGRRPGRR